MRYAPEVLAYLRKHTTRDKRGKPWSLVTTIDKMAESGLGTLFEQQLHDWEKGVTTPSATNLAKMAALYKVHPGCLFVESVESLAEAAVRDHLYAVGVLHA